MNYDIPMSHIRIGHIGLRRILGGFFLYIIAYSN